MTSFPDNKKFGGTDIRVVTDTHKDNFKTLNMHSPSTSGESKDMEGKMVADSPITTLSDTPFSPPTGHWDVGDTIRYGDNKWMMLGEDNESSAGHGFDQDLVALGKIRLGANAHRQGRYVGVDVQVLGQKQQQMEIRDPLHKR